MITGLLQFESFSMESLPNEQDRRFYGHQRNLGKNRRNAKVCGIKSDISMNNDVSRQDTSQKFSSQHGLGAESPSCLVLHSQTACAWQKQSGYVRLVISCLGGRKKCSTRRKGSKNCFSITEQFRQF